MPCSFVTVPGDAAVTWITECSPAHIVVTVIALLNLTEHWMHRSCSYIQQWLNTRRPHTTITRLKIVCQGASVTARSSDVYFFAPMISLWCKYFIRLCSIQNHGYLSGIGEKEALTPIFIMYYCLDITCEYLISGFYLKSDSSI